MKVPPSMPTSSWWVGLDRQAFRQACADEAERMSRSRFGSILVTTLAADHQRKLDKKRKEQETL